MHDGTFTPTSQFVKDPDSLCSTVTWKDEEDRAIWVYRIQVRLYPAPDPGCCPLLYLSHPTLPRPAPLTPCTRAHARKPSDAQHAPTRLRTPLDLATP